MTLPERLALVLGEMEKAEAEAAHLTQRIAQLNEIHLMLEGQKLLIETLIAEGVSLCPSPCSSEPSSPAH